MISATNEIGSTVRHPVDSVARRAGTPWVTSRRRRSHVGPNCRSLARRRIAWCGWREVSRAYMFGAMRTAVVGAMERIEWFLNDETACPETNTTGRSFAVGPAYVHFQIRNNDVQIKDLKISKSTSEILECAHDEVSTLRPLARRERPVLAADQKVNWHGWRKVSTAYMFGDMRTAVAGAMQRIEQYLGDSRACLVAENEVQQFTAEPVEVQFRVRDECIHVEFLKVVRRQ